MREELKLAPCPFCEADESSEELSLRGMTINGEEAYYVNCGACGARGPLVMELQIDAVEEWNRRPIVEGE